MESLHSDHKAQLRQEALRNDESTEQLAERHEAEMETLRSAMRVQTSAFEAQVEEQVRALAASTSDLDLHRKESDAARAEAMVEHEHEAEQLHTDHKAVVASLRSEMTLEHTTMEAAMSNLREKCCVAPELSSCGDKGATRRPPACT